MFDSTPTTKSSGREVGPSGGNGTFFADADDNTSRALAAGAAAGDDDDTQEVGGRGSKQQTKRTPRPPNAFILYRREKQPAIIAAQRHLSNAQVSRQISEMWRNESNETRLMWERLADRKKLEHMKAYPDYVYRPNKTKSKSEKMDKRRQQRRRESENVTSDAQQQHHQELESTAGPIRRKSRPLGRPTVQIAAKGFPQSTPPLSQPNTPSVSRAEQQVAYAAMMSNAEMLFDESLHTILPTTATLSSPITPVSPSNLLRHQEYQKIRQPDVVPTEEDIYPADFPQGHPQLHSLHFYDAPNTMDFWQVPDVISSTRHILDQAMLYQTPHESTQPTSHTVSSPGSTSTVGSSDGSPTIPSQPDSIVNTAIYGDSIDHFVAGNEHFAHLLAGYGLNEYLDGSGNHHDSQSV
jgi:hypothetical protein